METTYDPPIRVASITDLHTGCSKITARMNYAAVQGVYRGDDSVENVRLMRPTTPVGTEARQREPSQNCDTQAEISVSASQRHKSARKAARLTAAMKRAICIDFFSTDMKQKDISIRYSVERSTVSKALRTKEHWLTSDDLARLPGIKPGGHAWQQMRKRPRDCGKYPDLEKALASWGRQCTEVLSDELLREQALKLAVERGLSTSQFKASPGWLNNFKIRSGYSRHRFPTESPAAASPYSPISSNSDIDQLDYDLSPSAGIAERSLVPTASMASCSDAIPMPAFFRPPASSEVAEAPKMTESSSLSIIAPRPIKKIDLNNFSSLLQDIPQPEQMASPSLSFGTASAPSPFRDAFDGVLTPASAYLDTAKCVTWGGPALDPPLRLTPSLPPEIFLPEIASPAPRHVLLRSPLALLPYLSTTPLTSPGPHLGRVPYSQYLSPAFTPLPLHAPLTPVREPMPEFSQPKPGVYSGFGSALPLAFS